MPYLEMTGAQPKRFELDTEAESIVLGRSPDCQIVVSSNAVSRRHARLFWQGPELMIEDLGSSNGTFVNGERLTAPTGLKDKDRISFGSIEAVIGLPAPPAEPDLDPLATIQLPPDAVAAVAMRHPRDAKAEVEAPPSPAASRPPPADPRATAPTEPPAPASQPPAPFHEPHERRAYVPPPAEDRPRAAAPPPQMRPPDPPATSPSPPPAERDVPRVASVPPASGLGAPAGAPPVAAPQHRTGAEAAAPRPAETPLSPAPISTSAPPTEAALAPEAARAAAKPGEPSLLELLAIGAAAFLAVFALGIVVLRGFGFHF